jgi:hypothetical protein
MRHWTRREFARNAAITTLFAPFLATLENKTARAAAGKAKYVLLFVTPGTDVAAWSPKGSSESSITFSRMTEPLAPIKSNLVIVENLNSFGSAASHGAPGGLTGMNHGNPIHVSIDQWISDGLRAANIKTQIPNLILGGVSSEQQTTFYKAGRALSPIGSPTAAYQAVFSGGGVVGGDDMGSPTAAEDRLRRRKSILDLCVKELGQLSQTLGTAERRKLDVHTQSIRQLEERLTQQTGMDPGGGVVMPVACNKPASPTAASQPLQNSVLHLDVAVNAFACDLTRVASVQFGHHQSTQVTLTEVGEGGDWHNGFLHSDNPRTRLVNLERWLCTQFVNAANKLKMLPAPDGAGTLWDQTLMVWARDMGDGVIHDGSDMRFVFAGGAGGYLRTSANGRYLNGGGEHHMRALINIGEAMGITSFTGFGDPAAPPSARTPFTGIAAT